MTASVPADDGKARLRAWLPPVLAALLFTVTLWILCRELQAIHYRDVRAALDALPAGQILLALLLTATDYLVLTGYDQLAFIYVGKRLARWRIALTAFVSFAVNNNVGFALLSGTSVRHRFYSRWGLGMADLSRIVVFNSTIHWLGLLALGGWSLVLHPHAYLKGAFAQASTQFLGGVLMVVPAGYLLLSILRKTPLRLRGFELRVPPLPLAFGQLLVSVTDWVFAAAVLYALLPEGEPPYGLLLGTVLAAQLLGLVSHVPGGLGVFEGVMMLLLGPYVPADQLLAALLLYRLIYYVMPLVPALLVLVTDALRNRRAQIIQAGVALGTYSVQLAPRAPAVFTFMRGRAAAGLGRHAGRARATAGDGPSAAGRPVRGLALPGQYCRRRPAGAGPCGLTASASGVLPRAGFADRRWFNLGMAPLSGLEPSPVSPLWTRLGRFVYRHGEAFFNFEGLRAYKDKFDPVWEPRYLAYPGGLALPLVLADIAALSAGGYMRIFR